MAKLTEDQIKWILSVESTEAQQNIRQLTKQNRELEKANKDRRQEMIRLEMQGRKDSIAYKNLTTEMKNTEAAIRSNNAVIKGFEESMKLTDLTMAQLKKRAQELTRQLDGTAQSLHPEEYDKIKLKLKEVKERMSHLRDEGKKAQDLFGKTILRKGALATFMGNIYTKVAGVIGNLIIKAKDFIIEGTRMAGVAEGIDHAFKHIANNDYLDSMRKQTRGLISDLTLMKATVRAENFNIPLTQLGKLFEFAQNRARDTGENVDYLVDSIVNGIGRKSKPILDNLGISAVELDKELEKTGDFATAVGNIIEREMSKAGPAIDTAADAVTRKKVAWENFQISVGKRFLGLSKLLNNTSASIAETFTTLLRQNKKATEVYDDHVKKVSDLEVNIGTLAKRYEELKTKTQLNESEQTELNKILNTISSSIPGVVTEFDKYGNALSINTQKIWDFIAAEKEKLKYMHKEAIKEAEIDKLKKEQKIDEIEDLLKNGKIISQTMSIGLTGYSSTYFRDLTDIEREDLNRQKAILKGELEGINTYIKEMNGEAIEEQLAAQRKRVENRNKFNAMNQKELKAWITDEKNAQNEFMAIAKEVYNHRFGTDNSDDNNTDKKKIKVYEKEIKALDAALKKEKELIKNNYESNKITKNEYMKQVIDAEYKTLDKKAHIRHLEESDRKQFQSELLSNIDAQKALEETKLKEQYTNGEITHLQYNQKLLENERTFLFAKMDIYNLDAETQIQLQDKVFEYKIKTLEALKKIESNYFSKQKKEIEKQNQERDKQQISLGKRIAKSSADQLKDEYEQRVAANKRMADLTAAFSTELGQILGGAMTGNRDLVKDSIVSLVNIGLDYLKIQTQMAIAGATLASLAQPDSVITFGATGFSRALIMAGLIEAAFQAAKAVVGNLASSIGGSSSGDGSKSLSGNTRVLSGRESGGYMDVERAQDGRRYKATYSPARRGYVSTPTVIVGDGPPGRSKEWIAPNAALENPTIAPLIELLEQSRLQGTIRTIDLNQIIRTRMAGFASGGYVNDNPSATSIWQRADAASSSLIQDEKALNSSELLIELNRLLKKIHFEGVSVNYQQFDKAQKRIEGIKSKASRT